MEGILQTNFSLDDNSIMAIRDIFVEDIELLRNWIKVKDYFLKKPTERLQIEQMIQNSKSIHDIILKTLTLWITNLGNLATFDSCVDILLELNFVSVAENLKEKQHLIKHGFSPDLKLPTIWFHVDAPCHRFTGRVKELKILHEMLTKNDNNDGDRILNSRIESRLTVISGLGGIGKTTLVRAYVQEFKDIYTNIIWINAETKNSMIQSFKALAVHLHFQMESTTNTMPIELDISQNIINKLYSYLTNTKSLLIFDNAEEFTGHDGIQNFFPKSLHEPITNPPYILVTTRRLDLILDCEILPLDVLKEEESIDFIIKWLKLEQNLEEIKKLVHLLQMLPLALEQAGAYIARQELLRGKRQGCLSAVAQYINQYEINTKIILDNKYFQQMTLSPYEKTTLVTWTNTLDKIQEEVDGNLAIALMEIIAYLGSNNIPIELLKNFKNIDWNDSSTANELQKTKSVLPSIHENVETNYNLEIDVDEGLDLLKSYSMITELDGNIKVHRLVQKIIQIRIGFTKEKQVLNRIVQIIEIVFTSDQYDSFLVKCTEHSSIVLKKLVNHDELLREYPRFASTVCRKLDLCKNDEEIHSLTKNILCPKYNSLFGPKSFYSIELTRCLAWALRRLLLFNDALNVVEELLPIALNSLGHAHFLTLDLKNINAVLLLNLKKYEQAMVIFDETVNGYEQLEGKDSENVITVLHNKSGCLSALRKHKEAAQLYRYVYEMRQQILGEDHPFTLSTKHSLAVELFAELGEFNHDSSVSSKSLENEIIRKQALKLFKEVHEKYRTTLGEEHPTSLQTSNAIIFALLKKGGDNELAEEISRKTIKIQTKCVGKNHPDTLLTKHNLAVSLAQQGRNKEALDICEEIYPIIKEILGESNYITKRSAWWTEKLRKELNQDSNC